MPDGNDYALIQGAGNLSQTVTGLDTSKQYWLQFHAAGRNCCGDGRGTLSVSFGGQTLVPTTVMNPLGAGASYEFFQVAFSPLTAAGDLLFSTGTSVAGDHTLFLDSVSLIQRNANELVVANPSFEGSGTVATFPGYQRAIGGWNYSAVSGNPGVNTNAGPFYDNGINPDGANIGFIQQQGTLSQMVAGFEVGKVYELLYSYNARNGLSPTLRAAIGGMEAENTVVTQVGAGNPFHSDSFVFTANATEMMLEFGNLRAAPDDSTLLIDDVHIRMVPEPGAAVLALMGLMLAFRRRR
ncbi:MAG: hypothetical protein P8J87_02760 [Verrucomicrobiales bacterium]|nr:hypothetical protein [Verrucomicrobiales bacterium]